jgi:hypothetical protein
MTCYVENQNTNKSWGHGSDGRTPALQSPDVKPQYCPKRGGINNNKRLKNKNTLWD